MMRTLAGALALHAVSSLAWSADPAFKLGSFERDGKPFVGVVLHDSLVIDLAAADRGAAPGRARRPAGRPESR